MPAKEPGFPRPSCSGTARAVPRSPRALLFSTWLRHGVLAACCCTSIRPARGRIDPDARKIAWARIEGKNPNAGPAVRRDACGREAPSFDWSSDADVLCCRRGAHAAFRMPHSDYAPGGRLLLKDAENALVARSRSGKALM